MAAFLFIVIFIISYVLENSVMDAIAIYGCALSLVVAIINVKWLLFLFIVIIIIIFS